MEKTILSFDLSTACVGCVAARVNSDYEPVLVKSYPIIPPKFDVSSLGYNKSKKKIKLKNSDKYISTYIRKNEEYVSLEEKKRRDVEVRNASNMYVLDYIGKNIGSMVSMIKPDIILAEKNEIFNGVLTSVLLGKVMGVLIGVSAQYNIPVLNIKVSKARSVFNIGQLVKDFTKDKSAEELKVIPDITKRALRVEMERIYGKYGLVCSTDDESDSCVVFNYWRVKRGDI